MTLPLTATTNNAAAEVAQTKKHIPNATTTATTTTSTNTSKDVTRRMICGGLAGMIAKTATNPLERIKMLSQTGEAVGSKKGAKSSILGLYKSIVEREGILGLWGGNGVNLLRVFPAKAVVFSSNDFYRKFLSPFANKENNSNNATSAAGGAKLSGPWSFLAGGMAGMTATVVTYPLDFARGRIAGKLANEQGKKVYGGIFKTIAVTVKDEGMLALYKGVTPTMLGAMPYVGIQFGTVGLLENMFPIDNNSNDNSSALSPATRKMMFGGTGGVMAGLITYPNDTIRRLLQLQGSRGTTHEYKGYFDCLFSTIKTQGIRRLYAGLTINLIRMAPNTAVQFGSYE
eukprot:CAMPEP_0198150298 /NCGR_PEP_ID=MMETSP1443-20131203/50267_1 /TAXON_ID=186043 /ORGANISM="Entomoneis sp., Strain CCMP2396" /LENGTH=342 /DNA_ID=CAMNT_0043815567 /DNA_START=35 /DNA_END=1060 /DNA_ORIENTATION=+